MKKFGLLVVFLFGLATAQIVYAKTITVDGNGGEWVIGERIGTDGDEGAVVDNDIEEVYITNDVTTVYFRIDTRGNTNLTNAALFICVDTDNSTLTGATDLTTCNNAPGIDKTIVVDPSSNGCGAGTNPSLYDWGSANYVAATISSSTANNVTEIAIAVSDLGVADGVNAPIVASLVDSGNGCTAVNRDYAPDTGATAAVIGSGSPTAVTLQTVATQSSPVTLPLLITLLVFSLSTAVWVQNTGRSSQ